MSHRRDSSVHSAYLYFKGLLVLSVLLPCSFAAFFYRALSNLLFGEGGRHAKGNALDIGGFVLKDGTTMSVLKGWRSRAHGSTLKRMHKKACGPFKTVLGPNANRFHQDHFHFDVAKHRGGGTYCR